MSEGRDLQNATGAGARPGISGPVGAGAKPGIRGSEEAGARPGISGPVGAGARPGISGPVGAGARPGARGLEVAGAKSVVHEPAGARPRRGRRSSQTLEEAYPALAAEWDYARNVSMQPSDVSPGSSFKAWWTCSICGHGWEAIVNNRAKRGSGCPACAGRVVREGFNDVATLFPDLMSDWDWDRNEGLDPHRLMRTNNVRVMWKCHQCGNEWMSSLVTRTLHDSGCPMCRERANVEKGNLLTVRYPDVAAEWNHERNIGIDILSVAQYSDLSVWWRCRNCGNEYQARVRNRTNGQTGCPKCAESRFARRSMKSFAEQGLPIRIGVTYEKDTGNVFSGLGRCGLVYVYELIDAWSPDYMGLFGEDLRKASTNPPEFNLVEKIDTTGLKREGIVRTLDDRRITHFITGELGGNAMLSLASAGTLVFYDVTGDADACVRDLLLGTLRGKRLERAKAQRL